MTVSKSDAKRTVIWVVLPRKSASRMSVASIDTKRLSTFSPWASRLTISLANIPHNFRAPANL
jgi:hypothetical protein